MTEDSRPLKPKEIKALKEGVDGISSEKPEFVDRRFGPRRFQDNVKEKRKLKGRREGDT